MWPSSTQQALYTHVQAYCLVTLLLVSIVTSLNCETKIEVMIRICSIKRFCEEGLKLSTIMGIIREGPRFNPMLSPAKGFSDGR